MFEDLFGLAHAQAIGKSLYDLFPKEEAEGYCVQNRQVIESGQAASFEEVRTLPDGTTIALVTRSFPCSMPTVSPTAWAASRSTSPRAFGRRRPSA